MNELEFCAGNGPDGRLRIYIDDGSDEPPCMQSIGRYRMGTPLFECVAAAVRAAEPVRDKVGLYWPTRKGLNAALKAAREAAK